MRCLLVNLRNTGARPNWAGMFFPFGLAAVTAVLERDGHELCTVDLHHEQICCDRDLDTLASIRPSLARGRFDAILFGGVFFNFEDLVLISRGVRSLAPDSFQVIGGNLATSTFEMVLQHTSIDCVVRHEGEESVSLLLAKMAAGEEWREVPGLAYRDGEGKPCCSGTRPYLEDLDAMPFVSRAPWNFQAIRKSFSMGTPGRYSAVLFASRGCPFSCLFCAPLSGKKIRTRSARNILDEIATLKERWNIRYFRFFDEVFIGDRAKIIELCRLIKQEQPDIFWWCQTQVKLVDPELLSIMASAGCIEIAYGIESGSDLILAEMSKGISRELARQAIEMTWSVGIVPTLSLIAGMPSETPETLAQTRDFIISLNHIHWTMVPQIGFILPIPGTRLYGVAREKGLVADEYTYLLQDMACRDKYSNPVNLTAMPTAQYVAEVNAANRAIKRDYFRKHPLTYLMSLCGFNHIRWKIAFQKFAPSQIRPLCESLLYAVVVKRFFRAGRIIGRFLFVTPPAESDL